MKMIVMKMTPHITLINIPMITMEVGFVARIMMRLAQVVRNLIDRTVTNEPKGAYILQCKFL